MPTRTILVIDDDKAIHAVFRAILAKKGHRVVSALDANQGLMMARQSKPDLIVLDINMPAGGGYATYERIQMMSGTFQIPILVYTAVPLEEVKIKIPASPDVHFLAKPASPEEIESALERFIPMG